MTPVMLRVIGGSTVLKNNGEIIVIGGGALGMLSARQLAAAGCKVTLVERGRLGRGTSRAGGGIMSPLQPWEAPPAVAALAAVSLPMLPEITAALERDTGIDPQYRVTGMIYLELAEIDAAMDYARRAGLEAERLDGRALAALEPAARRTDGPSLYLPGIAQVRNPRLLDALAKDLEQRGVRLLAEAGECVIEQRAVGYVVDAGRHGRIAADQVVVAAGAWSAKLLEPLGVKLPLVPVRGQMTWYMLPRPVLGHMLMRNGRYVIPRQEGVVLVGSTVEEAGFDTGTTPEAIVALQAAASEMMPLLGSLAVQGQWAGLRPAAPDGIPLIGPVPGLPGLWVNTGHFRNGVNLAPGSAALLAALITGAATLLDPGLFDPAPRMAQTARGEYNASS